MLNFNKFNTLIQCYIIRILCIKDAYHMSLCNKKMNKLFNTENTWDFYLKRDYINITFNDNIKLSSKEKYNRCYKSGYVYVYGSNKNHKFGIEGNDLFFTKFISLNLYAIQIFISDYMSLILLPNGTLYHRGSSNFIDDKYVNQEILNNVKHIHYVDCIHHRYFIYEDFDNIYYNYSNMCNNKKKIYKKIKIGKKFIETIIDKNGYKKYIYENVYEIPKIKKTMHDIMLTDDGKLFIYLYGETLFAKNVKDVYEYNNCDLIGIIYENNSYECYYLDNQSIYDEGDGDDSFMYQTDIKPYYIKCDEKENIKNIVSLEHFTYINIFNNLFSRNNTNDTNVKISRNVKLCKTCSNTNNKLGIIDKNNNLFLMGMKNVQKFHQYSADKRFIISNVLNFECSYNKEHGYSVIVLIK